MNRRVFLKSVLVGLGISSLMSPLTASAMDVLESCFDENCDDSYRFLSGHYVLLVNKLADIIIPETHIKGALSLRVPLFIDKMYSDIETDESKKIFLQGATIFIKKFKQLTKKSLENGTPEDYTQVLDHYFNKTERKKKQIFEAQLMDIKKIKPSDINSFQVYKFLLTVRKYTMLGYFTSEYVAKEIHSYNPLPGKYKLIV